MASYNFKIGTIEYINYDLDDQDRVSRLVNEYGQETVDTILSNKEQYRAKTSTERIAELETQLAAKSEEVSELRAQVDEMTVLLGDLMLGGGTV